MGSLTSREVRGQSSSAPPSPSLWARRVQLALRENNVNLGLALVHEPDAVARLVELEPGAWMRNPDHHKPQGRAENELERAARVCRRSVGCGRLRDSDLVVRRIAPRQVTVTMAAEAGHWCTYVHFSGDDGGGDSGSSSGSVSTSPEATLDDEEPCIVQLTRLTDGPVVGSATLTQDSCQYRLHGDDEHVSFVNLSSRVAFVRRFRVRHCADGELVALVATDGEQRLGACMPPLCQSLKRCTGCNHAYFCGPAHFAEHRKTCRRPDADALLMAVRARPSLERCYCLRCVKRKIARKPTTCGAGCACSLGDRDLDRGRKSPHSVCRKSDVKVSSSSSPLSSASSSASASPTPSTILVPSMYSSADDVD